MWGRVVRGNNDSGCAAQRSQVKHSSDGKRCPLVRRRSEQGNNARRSNNDCHVSCRRRGLFLTVAALGLLAAAKLFPRLTDWEL